MKNINAERHPIYQRALIFIPAIFCVYGVFEAGKYFIHDPTIGGAVILFMLANGAIGFGLIALPIKNGERYLRYLTGVTALVELIIWIAHYWSR